MRELPRRVGRQEPVAERNEVAQLERFAAKQPDDGLGVEVGEQRHADSRRAYRHLFKQGHSAGEVAFAPTVNLWQRDGTETLVCQALDDVLWIDVFTVEGVASGCDVIEHKLTQGQHERRIGQWEPEAFFGGICHFGHAGYTCLNRV